MSATEARGTGFVITGRKMLFGMIAFFGVIFAVNGVFMYYALETFPGLTTDHAYVEGLEYNKVLEAAESQSLLGWQSTVGVEGDAGSRHLSIKLSDASGEPISGLALEVLLQRPVGAGEPMAVAASEVAPGSYITGPVELGDGRWHVAVVADDRYRMNDEVWITP